MWGGRLHIEFAPSSVLQRAKAWQLINEVRANYGDDSELAMLDSQLASFAVVMAGLAVLEIEKQVDDSPELTQFIDWCHRVTLDPITELFRDLVHMPVDFWDGLVDAFNTRPSYVPIAQAPIDKVPEDQREAALDPKAS